MTLDLAALFREHHDSLVRVLYRRTGDRDRAEDIAQETFARAVAAPVVAAEIAAGNDAARARWAEMFGGTALDNTIIPEALDGEDDDLPF